MRPALICSFSFSPLTDICGIYFVQKCVYVCLLLHVCSVMNLDRVENHTHVRRRFPRYHTTMFRAQTLWDPYTHVILPPAALVPQKPRQHTWKEKERTDKERKKRHVKLIKGFRVFWAKKMFSFKLSISASAPQNTASAPVSISANQTGEYTAARRTVSLPEAPITIVILLIYQSLGAALPPKYHTDRRGVRWESATLRTTEISLSQLQRPLMIHTRVSFIWW